ncbi:MAG: hypothetical protein WA667_14820 [Candidatus Nitrosopolaris sp.]
MILSTIASSNRMNNQWREPLFYPTNSKLLYTMKCVCCGADMLPDEELENTIIYKCKERGVVFFAAVLLRKHGPVV